MLERVERVTRIKGVKFDTEDLFQRRRGFDERHERELFASIFEDEIEKKKRRAEEESAAKDDAYRLDVGRATQSLFYQGKAELSGVRGKISHAR